ncbi:S8 family serine peptidase [Symbioplanes lichenis]|uniref:S8 family serine peptidase n=1 Tax=Symbioplanes lichenis TaxID=1629072 RepID=UPI0027392B8F|nr:S8 family serine peptidase [Actinoplanes lichenis]
MRAVRSVTLVAIALAAVTTLVAPATPALADSTRDRQWWLESLDVAAVHKVTQGKGITVAVVDTGVDADHPDLKGNVLPGIDLFDEKAKGQVDRLGHGTAMASLIAGHGHGSGGGNGVLGIAPEAKILPVTVMNENKKMSRESITAGITWALNNGADVISVSLGTGYDDTLATVMKQTWQRKVPVIAPAGNKNSTSGFPAAYGETIAVTGIDEKGGKAKESSRNNATAIAAPGENIIAAAPGGGYTDPAGSGTSDSTAIVAGAMALVLAQFPDLNSEGLQEQLLWTTKDAGDKGKDLDYGWGVLDLERAVTGKPDERVAQASPTPTGELNGAAQYEGCDGCPSTAEQVVQIVALFGGLCIVIGLIVFLLVRRSRKKRRQNAPEPAFAQQQQQPAARAVEDDQGWRRPPGA